MSLNVFFSYQKTPVTWLYLNYLAPLCKLQGGASRVKLLILPTSNSERTNSPYTCFCNSHMSRKRFKFILSCFLTFHSLWGVGSFTKFTGPNIIWIVSKKGFFYFLTPLNVHVLYAWHHMLSCTLQRSTFQGPSVQVELGMSALSLIKCTYVKLMLN